jgi:hypothetical protein
MLAGATYADSETLESGLVVHDDDGVSYVSGGIGNAQQEALKRIGSQYNLKITMATKDGKYIGGAQVRITDQQGRTAIDAKSDGPLFFAKLLAGKYGVHATADGKSLSQEVTVSNHGQTQIVLTWPQAAD